MELDDRRSAAILPSMRHEHRTRSRDRELIEKAVAKLGQKCEYPTVAYDQFGYQVGLIWYDGKVWHGADLGMLKALVTGKNRWYDGVTVHDVDYSRGESITTWKCDMCCLVASWRGWDIHVDADCLDKMPLRLEQFERANLRPL